MSGWMRDAACRDTCIPFFEDEPGYDEESAKAVCARCPVIDLCGQLARDVEGTVGADGRFGVFAGQSAKDRASLDRRTRRGRTGVRTPALTDAEHTERKLLHAAGMSDRQIARRRGVHPTAISQWRKRYGLPAIGSRQQATA